ncbi:MAG: LLM class flavin-dependent oxidoreductase [Acidimicrobiia bacterium]|nr:LLM class flavin-dependent oxidoreductase [Acidimicrobiia bacterium]
MSQPFRFGVMYDCRRRPDGTQSMADVYAATVEQAALADQLGIDMVWFTEHHFVEDGYLPAFQPVAGAVAARTGRIRISTDIALLPLYHPIRLAEELAVLDQLSNGRMEFGIGMGYVPEEFRAFGVSVRQRVSLTEEAIDILRLAWGDAPVHYAGKRYQIDGVEVFPKPVQPGGPPLWIAAMKEPGAQRAARFDTHLLPQGTRAEVLDPWRAALEASGRDPGAYRVGIARSMLVTDDPERDWPTIRDAERYRMSVYQRFFAETPDEYSWGRKDAQPIPQTWIVGDADHCVRELRAFCAEYGITDVSMSGLPPGVDPEVMGRNLERIATEVLPRVRAGS